MSPELDALVLAAAGDAEQIMTRVLPWLAAVVGALILLAAGVTYSRSQRRRGPGGSELPWTLQELRKMHARGDVDDAEYQRLRERLRGLADSLGPAGGDEPTGAADTSGNDGQC